MARAGRVALALGVALLGAAGGGAVAPLAAAQGARGPAGPVRPIPGGPKLLLPDLVIRSFRLKALGQCAPGAILLKFEVTVVNVGAATAPHQPEELAWVFDATGNWFNGAGGGQNTHGPLPPGQAATGVANLFYMPPKFPPGPPPWTFKAVADPLKVIAESNEGNNESKPLTIAAGPCERLK